MTHFVVGSLVVAVDGCWLWKLLCGCWLLVVVVVVGSRGPMFLVDPVLLPGAPIRLHKKKREVIGQREAGGGEGRERSGR